MSDQQEQGILTRFIEFIIWLLIYFKFYKPKYRIAVVGQPEVGKTSIISKLKENIESKEIITKRSEYEFIEFDHEWWFKHLTGYLNFCDGVIYVMDASNHKTCNTDIKKLLFNTLFPVLSQQNIPILCLANKKDVKEAAPRFVIIKRLELEKMMKAKYQTFFNFNYCTCCIQEDRSLLDGFQSMVNQMENI